MRQSPARQLILMAIFMLPVCSPAVDGKTAIHNGLSVTLLRAGPLVPDADDVHLDSSHQFYIVQVRYENRSTRQQTYNTFDFEIATTSRKLIRPTVDQRQPALGYGDLRPGQNAEGWITFEIPTIEEPSGLLYSPTFDTHLVIPI